MKVYDDFFCPKCQRFQSEVSKGEVKLLQIFKLNKYLFNAQKYTYIIYNELGSKVAIAEKRDVSKFVSDKNYGITYYLFNDINRIIVAIDSAPLKSQQTTDSSWKVYDYARNLRGEIEHLHESDTWQIIDKEGSIIALRDPKDSRSLKETMRQFTIVDANDSDKTLFQVFRKGGFNLTMIDKEIDPHLGWGFVIALHRKLYT